MVVEVQKSDIKLVSTKVILHKNGPVIAGKNQLIKGLNNQCFFQKHM
jgi:hypothetical protein